MGRLLPAMLSLLLVFGSGAATAQTLERIRETGTINIGFREDAAPFSYRNGDGDPVGYTIDFCAAVVAGIKNDPGFESVAVNYVPVTTKDRFDAVAEGRIDLLCGATTVTLSRRELVDFSLPIFVTGGGLLFREDGPQSFEELAGHAIGVRAATTMSASLVKALEVHNVEATVVEVNDHRDGIEKLSSGEIAAYFGDRAILAHLLTAEYAAVGLKLSNLLLTFEPYALALAHGDDDFRLVVDRMVSRIYRSGTIESIYRASFGNDSPGALLEALYVLNGLPE